jgi:hypothetical protein
MCRVMHSYYSKLYTLEEVDSAVQESLLALIDNKFNREARETLNTDLTIEELKDTLKSMDSNKAPGSDDFLSVFYKTFSNVALPLVLKTFMEAFKMTVFPAEIVAGQIVLLYKKENFTLMQNYWLITLLNVDYKIVTKTLTKRFFKILANMVSLY